MKELQNRRAYLCRLTPDRALESPEEALDFLRDRGLLTRTPDSALPSLFEACHEEAYAVGSRGFGSWPATKYPWYFELADRPDVDAGLVQWAEHERDPLCRWTVGSVRASMKIQFERCATDVHTF